MLCADKGRTVKNWDREAVEKNQLMKSSSVIMLEILDDYID
jgi:hypothetical protein